VSASELHTVSGVYFSTLKIFKDHDLQMQLQKERERVRNSLTRTVAISPWDTGTFM